MHRMASNKKDCAFLQRRQQREETVCGWLKAEKVYLRVTACVVSMKPGV